MENNEVIEGNKLIAEFMGGKWETVWHITDWPHSIHKDTFEYHTSWDWLMPVYKKFIDLPFSENSMQAIRNNYSVRINAAICAVDIKEAHRHLTNGIKWYKTTNLK